VEALSTFMMISRLNILRMINISDKFDVILTVHRR